MLDAKCFILITWVVLVFISFATATNESRMSLLGDLFPKQCSLRSLLDVMGQILYKNGWVKKATRPGELLFAKILWKMSICFLPRILWIPSFLS